MAPLRRRHFRVPATNTSSISSDHPAYSDDATERDPHDECPHGIPWAEVCHDCEGMR